MRKEAKLNSGSRTRSNTLPTARPTHTIKTVFVGFVAAGICFAGSSQSFQNLDFEEATLIPITGGYSGEVQIGPALPEWTVFTQAPFILYDNMFLDSAGISILDTNAPYGYQALNQAFQGTFTVLLQGGFTSYPDRQSVAIAQTGMIPTWANTLLFDAWMPIGESNFVVSLAGENLPFYALANYGNFVVYALDVSGFAGRTVELRFTANPNPPPGLAINNIYLDDIRFSSSPLAVPPLILKSPANQSVNMGSTVDFAVYATAYPNPAYQWFFNGTNIIADATNLILELTNVQYSQSGSYTVVITNIYGSAVSAPAILTVRDPFIGSQPVGRSVDAGQLALLGVGAGGTPPLRFQWLKNGIAVNDGGNISGTQTRWLTFSNALGGDAGAYTVIVSNSYGSVTSQLATLIVHDPLVLSQPVSQTVGAGGTATFGVVAAGTTPFAYQWFDAGVRLNDGENISGAQTATLTLANVLGGEADAYWVIVSNSYGNVTSQVAFVSMSQPLYTVLHHFSNWVYNPYSGNPTTDLLLSGGTLCGAAQATIFRINTDGTEFTVISDLMEGAIAGLVMSNETFYGTLANGPGQVFKINTDGTGFIVLHDFTGSADGSALTASPVFSGSTLYGTTYTGGSSGYGNVFKINTDGSGFAVLKDFDYTAGHPEGGLAISGNTLYGTLTYNYRNGGGFVFKINTDGSGFVILKSFSGSDGKEPRSALIVSGATLYGTTYYGGTGTGIGFGTIFKVNTDGSGFAVLKSFAGGTEGANPVGDLVQSGSTLYGTTSGGGISNCGTIFKIEMSGSNFAVLKRFRGSDGANPNAGLVKFGSTLYGTTSLGGISNRGVIFALCLPEPPAILSDLPSQTVEAGSAVDFGPDVSGYAPSYEWFFNGTNLIGGGTFDGGMLTLTNADFSKSGSYTVVVTNIFGAMTSAPVALNVIPAVERKPVPGIHLTGDAGTSLNVEYTDALGSPTNWLPLVMANLTNPPQYVFDATTPLPPQRFYRTREISDPPVLPTLDLHMVPAITLTGNIGDKLRLDLINQIGPTDAWVTLDTVTLTNTSQLYFDTSAIDRPTRLYRIVPVP